MPGPIIHKVGGMGEEGERLVIREAFCRACTDAAE